MFKYIRGLCYIFTGQSWPRNILWLVVHGFLPSSFPYSYVQTIKASCVFVSCMRRFIELFILSLEYIWSPFLDYNLLENRDDHIGHCNPSSSNRVTCTIIFVWLVFSWCDGEGFWLSIIGGRGYKIKGLQRHFKYSKWVKGEMDKIGEHYGNSDKLKSKCPI